MAALTAILLTAAALAGAEVLLDAEEESLFTLSPSVDVIAFSNYTTNNPLDNLKDFPDTWSPGFDVHEFQVEEGEVRDQLAVETSHQQPTIQVSTSAIIATFTITSMAEFLPPKYTLATLQRSSSQQPLSSLLMGPIYVDNPIHFQCLGILFQIKHLCSLNPNFQSNDFSLQNLNVHEFMNSMKAIPYNV